MKNANGMIRSLGWLLTLLSLLHFASGCAYQDRVAPLILPGKESGLTLPNGLKLSATPFVGDDQARQALGFDARGAGLLPVQLTFQNDSPDRVIVNPAQTFLIDHRNQAWPILPLEKTYQRTHGWVDIGETAKGAGRPALLMGAAGALAGLAVGVITGQNIGEAMGTGAVIGAASGAVIGGAGSRPVSAEKIRHDLAGKTLQNAPILPQQIAYGVLFFPGIKGEEADGAKELRLSLTIGKTPQIITIHLSEQTPGRNSASF